MQGTDGKYYCNGLEAVLVTDLPMDADGYYQGTDGADVIAGTRDADKIDSGKGNDVICGYGGNDEVHGANRVAHFGTAMGSNPADCAHFGGNLFLYGEACGQSNNNLVLTDQEELTSRGMLIMPNVSEDVRKSKN